MSTYVVGDIQGCYRPLQNLLKKVKFVPSRDKLWCVGDLVNRGPRSLETLRFLREIDESVKIVLGNHDLHFIAIHEGCAPDKTKDTLAKTLDAPDCDELSNWLRNKPLAYFDSIDTDRGIEDFLMVHAGVAPLWSLQRTLNLAAEVELALQTKNYRAFLKNMYGNHPIRWHNQLEGYDRLRTITNYLTRIRFCDNIGNLRLNIKEGLNAAPPGFKPWFEFEKISHRATILFGHWAALEGRTGKCRVHALDTGYVWGRELTLMRLEDRCFYSVKN
ncbi:MAG: diadenosine tetraphosphatase [Gammaproteobacteria bacterium]|nr:diadenosine tetraphosphatase [Gammaproteobacteria bacterium]|tara:strand:- start:2271 stop:3092 length:822 start_codon:yes stop_codon:yes gene_type:complete